MVLAKQDIEEAQIRREIIQVLEKRGVGKTCCPSEIPRKLFPKRWRDYMALTRLVAVQMVKEGLLDIYQRGKKVEIDNIKGPIRLRLKSSFTD